MEKFINDAPFIVVLLCLVAGFVFLVKGADLFVEGSSSVAKRFKVPSPPQRITEASGSNPLKRVV